jgi:tripartite-type tricarboxylate transporter receptor subunit TctC
MNVIRKPRNMASDDMRTSRIAAVLLATFLFPVAAPAQTYPTKPVRIVVAASAGGSPDIISRMMGPRLTEILGQPMVIDNRAGASGMIAVELAAKAAPDGYTVLMATSSQACVEVLTQNPRYKLDRDFAPISLVGTVTSVLLANPAVPATSVAQLVALAKSRPGALKHGSSGHGSSSHLPAELFKIRTGTNILHVPYKAASPALVGLMAGEIDVMFSAITAAMSPIKTGKLRALGVTSLKRNALALDLPTIAETIPGFEFLLWQSLMAPAKTPPEILSRLNAAVNQTLVTPSIQEGMKTIGNEPHGTSLPGLTAFVNDYLHQIRDLVRIAGVKLEQ